MSERRLQKCINKATSFGLTLILLSISACEATNFSTLKPPEGDSQPSSQVQKQRVALVIGNADYSEDALSNPTNDAADIADALKSQGFKVILRLNQNLKDMENGIADFKQQFSL